jgi:translation initiation factor 3 subunit E
MAHPDAAYDLTFTIIKSLDRHQVLPLLQYLQEKKLYKDDDLVKAKLDLLLKTKMLDTADEEYKTLHKTDQIPKEMSEIRNQVYAQLKDWKEACAPLLDVLTETDGNNNRMTARWMDEKNFTMDFLARERNITPEHLENLYRYAKLMFEIGQYASAADYLFYYRKLSNDMPKNQSALWGKLAAEILLGNYEFALEDLNTLAQTINDNVNASHPEQLQQRTWLIHWSLFIFFNTDNGRQEMVNFLYQDKLKNTVQTNCPHILRYLTISCILNHHHAQHVQNEAKDMKALVKVLNKERNNYLDPITEFLRVLKTEYDFEAVQSMLKKARAVVANDFFLNPLADEFVAAARLLIFETYCKLHKCIDMDEITSKLDLSPEEAEGAILSLIQEANINAKIDSDKNQLVMGQGPQHRDIYQQVLDKTKGLAYRSQQLADKIDKRYEGMSQRD